MITCAVQSLKCEPTITPWLLSRLQPNWMRQDIDGWWHCLCITSSWSIDLANKTYMLMHNLDVPTRGGWVMINGMRFHHSVWKLCVTCLSGKGWMAWIEREWLLLGGISRKCSCRLLWFSYFEHCFHSTVKLCWVVGCTAEWSVFWCAVENTWSEWCNQSR